MKSLRRNVQQLQKLIGKVLEENSNLLADSGIKLEKRWFDLWPLVEALLDDLDTVAAAANTKVLNRVPDDLIVFADASLLRRVFQNLIGNAIRFSPGGEVIVGAQAQVPRESSSVGSATTARALPPSCLTRSLTRVNPAAMNGTGSGLGLAIVKTFIEAHDGQVAVDSVIGQGSRFHFTIPVQATPGV